MTLPAAFAASVHLIPVFILQEAAQTLFKRLLKQHPGLFERLGEHRQKSFAFRPVDVPLSFIVCPLSGSVLVRRERESSPAVDVAVEGPLLMLLALLEGRSDADALFFSRDVTVTGDMEAVLALRNALDDFSIDLPRDLAPLTGPLAPIFRRLAERIRNRLVEPQKWN
jgi:predicted lipid carrier protein YhbT